MRKVVVVKKRDSIAVAVNLATESRDDSTLKAHTRILIAEDREFMRDALKRWFRLCKNWEVCGEANDANEAVREADRLRPDLIVIDYKMHDTNGLQAAGRILTFLPDVPIVMFTLYKTDELERAAKKVGIRCVVGKEEGVSSLLDAVQTQLPC